MSARSRLTALTPPLYAARVEAHQCERWIIPACKVTIPAVSEIHARRLAVQAAHRRAGGLPPWRPLGRLSLAHATARRVVGEGRRRESWGAPA